MEKVKFKNKKIKYTFYLVFFIALFFTNTTAKAGSYNPQKISEIESIIGKKHTEKELDGIISVSNALKYAAAVTDNKNGEIISTTRGANFTGTNSISYLNTAYGLANTSATGATGSKPILETGLFNLQNANTGSALKRADAYAFVGSTSEMSRTYDSIRAKALTDAQQKVEVEKNIGSVKSFNVLQGQKGADRVINKTIADLKSDSNFSQLFKNKSSGLTAREKEDLRKKMQESGLTPTQIETQLKKLEQIQSDKGSIGELALITAYDRCLLGASFKQEADKGTSVASFSKENIRLGEYLELLYDSFYESQVGVSENNCPNDFIKVYDNTSNATTENEDGTTNANGVIADTDSHTMGEGVNEGNEALEDAKADYDDLSSIYVPYSYIKGTDSQIANYGPGYYMHKSKGTYEIEGYQYSLKNQVMVTEFGDYQVKDFALIQSNFMPNPDSSQNSFMLLKYREGIIDFVTKKVYFTGRYVEYSPTFRTSNIQDRLAVLSYDKLNLREVRNKMRFTYRLFGFESEIMPGLENVSDCNYHYDLLSKEHIAGVCNEVEAVISGQEGEQGAEAQTGVTDSSVAASRDKVAPDSLTLQIIPWFPDGGENMPTELKRRATQKEIGDGTNAGINTQKSYGKGTLIGMPPVSPDATDVLNGKDLKIMIQEAGDTAYTVATLKISSSQIGGKTGTDLYAEIPELKDVLLSSGVVKIEVDDSVSRGGMLYLQGKDKETALKYAENRTTLSDGTAGNEITINSLRVWSESQDTPAETQTVKNTGGKPKPNPRTSIYAEARSPVVREFEIASKLDSLYREQTFRETAEAKIIKQLLIQQVQATEPTETPTSGGGEVTDRTDPGGNFETSGLGSNFGRLAPDAPPGFYIIRNNATVEQDRALLGWLQSGAGQERGVYPEELIRIIMSYSKDIRQLTFEEYQAMRDIQTELDYARDNKVQTYITSVIKLLGRVMVGYAMLMLIVYWFDVFNTLTVDLNLTSVITRGRLYAVRSREEANVTRESRNPRYVDLKDVLIRSAIMIVVASMFMQVDPLLNFISRILNLASNIIAGGV